MSNLNEHLDDLDPTPAVRSLAAAVAGRTAVESHRQEQYVSLRPSMEGAVAVYLHRTYASIALPPERAASLAAQIPGSQLRKKTPATSYLVLPDQILTEQPQLSADIADEAVAWRATGPKSRVGSAHHAKTEKEEKGLPGPLVPAAAQRRLRRVRVTLLSDHAA
ncbi:hypothetical protein [Blastococcus deserti]|uniref:Uncharacterized protein n=1 Tax=Blastococcus deserti TaxID=2259033 RepID=A0ABW4X521_9ACTN